MKLLLVAAALYVVSIAVSAEEVAFSSLMSDKILISQPAYDIPLGKAVKEILGDSYEVIVSPDLLPEPTINLQAPSWAGRAMDALLEVNSVRLMVVNKQTVYLFRNKPEYIVGETKKLADSPTFLITPTSIQTLFTRFAAEYGVQAYANVNITGWATAHSIRFAGNDFEADKLIVETVIKKAIGKSVVIDNYKNQRIAVLHLLSTEEPYLTPEFVQRCYQNAPLHGSAEEISEHNKKCNGAGVGVF